METYTISLKSFKYCTGKPATRWGRNNMGLREIRANRQSTFVKTYQLLIHKPWFWFNYSFIGGVHAHGILAYPVCIFYQRGGDVTQANHSAQKTYRTHKHSRGENNNE